MIETGHILALCGGVGGAKMVLGLARVVAPERLTVVVNTGDDFEHMGLPISPDVDTVLYTLAGLANRELGWGRQDETWSALEELSRLGAPDWFRLGDRDIALHLTRRHLLDSGATLSEAVRLLGERLGVVPRVVPMSDAPVRTFLDTDAGVLPFQEYFVARRCAPSVRRVILRGAETATPAPGVAAALADPDLVAILICPSNPFLSIDPMLAIPGVRQALRDVSAPVVAVSPLIAGQAVKGPAAKLCAELGLPASAEAVARPLR